VVNVEVVIAIVADFAILPLNCPAGNTGEAAELTFCGGGRLAHWR